MTESLDQFANNLIDLRDTKEVWSNAVKFSEDRGFDGVNFTMVRNDRGRIRSKIFLSNFSDEFCSNYSSEWVRHDPFLLFSCHTMSAKRITADGQKCYPAASREQNHFLQFAADNGASKGIGIPVSASSQVQTGGWIFSSRESQKTYQSLCNEYSCDLQLAALLAYERMTALGLREEEKRGRLSAREKECLLWLCAGLRITRISEKLGISESAVHLYLANARQKLGARTSEQAIARAIVSGAIEL